MKSNNEEVTHSGVEYVEKIETVFSSSFVVRHKFTKAFFSEGDLCVCLLFRYLNGESTGPHEDLSNR